MHSDLLKLGWSEHLHQHLHINEHAERIPARITREDRDRYSLHTGARQCSAQLSGSYRHSAQSTLDLPTVGDWVLFEPGQTAGEGIIHGLLPRKSLFTRQVSGDRSDLQLLAANIDYLFIVAGLDQEFNPKRIERYLTQAWNSGAEPVVILNKSDLVEDASERVRDLCARLPEVSVHAISALSPASTECLSSYLASGNTVALSGSSGVGKSSLINALLGEELLKTQANRADDNRGRHTTTWRALFQLESGACLIDLPGMRELQLTGESAGMEKAFSDIYRLAGQCKFRNCHHEGEPGCAIEAALDSGQLTEERFQQYLKLRNESHSTRRPKPKPTYRKPAAPGKWEEKETFFKQVKIQHRKNNKAKRKYHQEDGF
ncbi:ribosome small subunit-dependent GTPase A [Ruficoccus sp. ZRK36]|uniref:ribosome small subunit-dependent GTPase A n=1 Tax=Ruficoccus sp. ZRK36 TaxID=2866311 RepID=UPI001C734BDE|nr:ribosome small subunit-dependent GTPase A [Ruficoccus sp. ZRK36]QYY35104.1 ribosome small subunit-dependent GTPase A [Ruficoccus sp. ZRK36]